MLLKNGSILNDKFQLENSDILFEDDKIKHICSSIEGDGLDISGLIAIPGLIDIHIHGRNGSDAMDGDEAALINISSNLAKRGITAFLPTTMTQGMEEITRAAKAIAPLVRKQLNGATILGINVEGPFISPLACGAQDPNKCVLATEKAYNEIKAASKDSLKIISVAPETEGAIRFIEGFSSEIVCSLGHTKATYEQALDAFNAGAQSVTHFYNCMTPFTHRAPGVVGAVFEKKPYAELICDLVHVHKSVILTSISIVGEDKIILISDSMRATGLCDGEYDLGGAMMIVKDGVARTRDGAIAGSTTDILACVKNLCKIGVSFEKSIKFATLNPASLIGEDKRGCIREGNFADITVIDDNFNVKYVFIGGRLVYEAI